MDLWNLVWTFVITNAPLVNYEGYDSTGRLSRRVQFTLCETARFESVLKTNGVYVLQVSESTNGGWETFGRPILGPTTNNIQTLPVPKKQPGQPRVFRLQRK